MRYDVKWAELHNPLFLNGVNLQMKLDPSKRTGLALYYDKDEEELHVWFNMEVAVVPKSNCATIVPKDKNVLGYLPSIEVKKPAPAPAPVGHAVKAQVSTPTMHVFEPGKGRSGK